MATQFSDSWVLAKTHGTNVAMKHLERDLQLFKTEKKNHPTGEALHIEVKKNHWPNHNLPSAMNQISLHKGTNHNATKLMLSIS